MHALIRNAPQITPVFARDAWQAWDFTANRRYQNGRFRGLLSSTPNWTFSRASTGYALNSSGVLVAFSSGQLRRTDRGVLIEWARTNLALRSQEFDNASWTKANSSVDANQLTAPDGTTTADFLIEDGSAGAIHGLTPAGNYSVTSGSSYTQTVFAKAGTRSWLRIGQNSTADSLSQGFAWFNLTNGTVGTTTGVTASIVTLANGWYRCAVTWTAGATSSNASFVLRMATQDNETTYNGDGVSGLYLWGAQLEAASHHSSYIPTTSSSATRAADSLSITSVTGLSYPLTLYAEVETGISGPLSGLAYISIAASDGTTSNRTALHYYQHTTTALITQVGGATQADVTVAGTLSAGTLIKSAGRAGTNDFIVAKNGTLSSADTSGSVPASPTVIEFGSNGNSSYLFGYLRRAAIYASAKSDAQLTALTS